MCRELDLFYAATPRRGSGRRSAPSDAHGGGRRRRMRSAPSSRRPCSVRPRCQAAYFLPRVRLQERVLALRARPHVLPTRAEHVLARVDQPLRIPGQHPCSPCTRAHGHSSEVGTGSRLRSGMIRDAFRRRRPGVAKAFAGLDGADLIVTGTSRSGTSYLCNLLHRFDNCVAINEPLEVISILRAEEGPRGLPAYYGTLRADIQPQADREQAPSRAGRRGHGPPPAAPSVSAAGRRRRLRPRNQEHPRVSAAAGRRASRHAERRIVACVRNPVDTIASWKASFQHLNTADVGPFVDHPQLMWLAGREREALQSVAATADLATRRAPGGDSSPIGCWSTATSCCSFATRSCGRTGGRARTHSRGLPGRHPALARRPVHRALEAVAPGRRRPGCDQRLPPAADRLGLPVLVH